MNIFVIGSTGHLGRHTVNFLVSQKQVVQCLCRAGSETKIKEVANKVNIIVGDVFSPANLVKPLIPGSVFIHLVGGLARNKEAFWRLNYESAKNMIDLALATDCSHFILVSAVGQIPLVSSEYIKSKIAAEKYLQKSELNWTIFKPSEMVNWNFFFSFINFGLDVIGVVSRNQNEWQKKQLLPVEKVAQALGLVAGKQKYFFQTLFVPDILEITA